MKLKPNMEKLCVMILIGGMLDVCFCLNFNFPSFPREVVNNFIMHGTSYIVKDAIQVTNDLRGQISNTSGRIWYNTPFKLWDLATGTTASFNSTFQINITPATDPPGEGLAFIITANTDMPENSYGQWLGIVNSTTNGTGSASVVAVEFDTKKSFQQDVDGNHVGLNVNTVYSIQQAPLLDHGVNISSAKNVTATILYDGDSKNLSVFVRYTQNVSGDPIFSRVLDISELLPQNVYVGFSASTGDSTELNCVLSWNFASTEIGGDGTNLTWLWIVIPIVAGLSALGTVWYWLLRRRKYRERMEEEEEQGFDESEDPTLELEIQKFTRAPVKFRLKEIRSATGEFSAKNELGRGGFGTVYKGTLNGRFAAVKRFSKRSEHGKQDFVAEVKTIGNLHHKNLVKLLGWCHESRELILVYEFMPNGSLDRFLFPGDVRNETTLGWERRHGVMTGVAMALDYLHNGCDKRVLHRDIKASNVLLDFDFNPRLGDFGLARTIQLADQTHHSTNEIAGTPGYMAPETFHTGRATPETDVYAFGVFLLEAVCARKPGFQNEHNEFSNGIVDWVWSSFGDQMIESVVDPRLKGDFNGDQAYRALLLGLGCCHPNPHRRPSVRTALQVLTGQTDPPEVPTQKPVFMWPPTLPTSFHTDTSTYIGGQLTASTVLTAR